MRQKLIIGFSVLLLLLAVILIAYDLFHESPTKTTPNTLTKQNNTLKEIDPKLIGYKQITTIETHIENTKGIAIDQNGQIFVCSHKQVVSYNKSGKKLIAFDIDSSAHCIEIKNNAIYLGIGTYISHYSIDGELVQKFKPYNDKSYITSLSTDANYIYAADAINKIVLKYSINGEFIEELGTKDTLRRKKGFIVPSLYFDVEAGGFNDIWVANPGYLRLENFSSTGSLRSMWGEASYENEGFPGCCNPSHFSILPDGSFVTYEKGLDKIKIFNPAGQFKCIVAGAGSFKGDADFLLGRKNLVDDLDTDKNGLIYILDAYNRICIFKEIKKTDT